MAYYGPERMCLCYDDISDTDVVDCADTVDRYAVYHHGPGS